MKSSNFLADTKARIESDPDARFAVSLDRLAYAKDNHVLGTDLVRTYVRQAATEYLAPNEAVAVARLRRGMNALTGRARVLGRRYGELAAEVRDAGGSVFDWVSDAEARAAVQLVSGFNRELADRIAGRSAA